MNTKIKTSERKPLNIWRKRNVMKVVVGKTVRYHKTNRNITTKHLSENI